MSTGTAGGRSAGTDEERRGRLSSPRFLRDGWRSLASDVDASFVLVFVDAARETVLQRQRANRASGVRFDVTDAVMSEHLATFEPPGPDEDFVLVESASTAQQVVTAVGEALRRAA